MNTRKLTKRITKSSTMAKTRYLKDRSISLKNGGLEKINEMIQDLTFDEVVVFLQDKVRQAVKEFEEDIKPKSKKKIDSTIMKKLNCLIKENKHLRNKNIDMRNEAINSQNKIRNLKDGIQNEEVQIAELREKLLRLKKKKIEMDYMVEANELRQFVEESERLNRITGNYKEENETHEVIFREDDQIVEFKGDNGIHFQSEKMSRMEMSEIQLLSPSPNNYIFSSAKQDKREIVENREEEEDKKIFSSNVDLGKILGLKKKVQRG